MKLFLTAFFCLSMCFLASGQATAHFTASATIIQPIGINKISDLNFAEIDAKEGGEIVLTPQEERITAGHLELADGTMVSAATFQITGEQGFAFSITLPSHAYELVNGSESMIIKDFTSSLGATGNFSNGISSVKVGATLQVKPSQTPGYYSTNSPLSITVNYN